MAYSSIHRVENISISRDVLDNGKHYIIINTEGEGERNQITIFSSTKLKFRRVK